MRISDWSSDVCSSDLSSDVVFVPTGLGTEIRALEWLCRGGGGNCSGSSGQRERDGEKIAVHETCLSWVSFLVPGEKIGRASCRERVCQYVSISVVAGSLKKKMDNI